MVELRWVFEKGIKAKRETWDESRKTLQAISNQVVEQVHQPRSEVPLPAQTVDPHRQIQNPPALALRWQVNLLQPPSQNQSAVGGPMQPEPVEIAPRVADLGNQQQLLIKDRNWSYSKRRLTIDDLRWVIKEVKTCKDQVRSDPPRRRRHGGHDLKQWKTGQSQKFGYEGCFRMRLQCRRAKERCQQQMENSEGMTDLAQLLPVRMKSFWILKVKNRGSSQTSLEDEKQPRSPTSPQVLTVETKKETGLKATFKVAEEMENLAKQETIQFDLMETEVTISDFIRGVNCSRGISSVELTVRNRTFITEVVKANDKPFVANTNSVETHYYDEEIGTIRFFGMDCNGKPARITVSTRSTLDQHSLVAQ
ncbi:hypothetical protein SLEP1_g54968 [Rubroshorea leprosula]|uniref:Uncharacterized protein n=1 Tax=Rubroshorea leprosula TaxID=152421 RepID=A0AAV5MGZ8_9ROSI|nr:hypothetical protein SLEP1_g54968 [Rubroshorea leprosula]